MVGFSFPARVQARVRSGLIMWMVYLTEEDFDVPFCLQVVCISRAIRLLWEAKGNSDCLAKEFGGGEGSDWF